MEEEIDLRPYVSALLRRGHIIILSGLLVGGLAFLFASVQRTNYLATTIIAFLEPTESVQFDTRFETVPSRTSLLRSLPSLSKSDEIMAALLTELDIEGIDSITKLERHLTAESGTDLNLLYLQARSESPEAAAQLVNQWAEVFVDRANEIYANRGDVQLDFYVQQVEDAAARLDTTEQALAMFQGTNRLALVSNELTSLTNLQSAYVNYSNSLARLQNDIRAARAQQTNLADGTTGVAGDYTTLALQSRVIELQNTIPLTIQLTPADNLANTGQNQVQFLDSLEAIIAEMRPALEAELDAIEPRILGMQREQVALQARLTRLTTDRDLALETYKTLSRKLDEERLTANDTSFGFRQVSRAVIPEMPVGSNRSLAALAGAALGMILASVAIILYTWWRK